MIRVAICDDDEKEGQRVYRLLEKCFLNRGVFYQHHIFNNSKALLYEAEDGAAFDILLLDIEMPQMDGMELTSRLKTFLPDALVIFITSHEKYVYDSFKVQPYRFIPKKRIEQMLPAALNDAVETIKSQEGKYYIAKNQKGVEKVLQKSITHIWHSGKYSYIEKSNGGNTKVRATLKAVYEGLDQESFEWIDRGCICNLAQVMQIVEDSVVMTNGTKLQVSRDRLPDLKIRMRKYLTKKEGLS